MWRVLIVGGDGARASALRETLRAEGYGVVCARDVAGGVRLAPDVDLAILALEGRAPNDADLRVLLDRRVPVMMFPSGGDAESRRNDAAPRPALARCAFDGIQVDFARYRAERDGVAVDLTPREFEILRYLVERRDRIVSRAELLRAVWGESGGSLTRTVDVHIAKLRKKIGDEPYAPRYILTVHGAGYRFVA
jgi:DNA-binding response OmpR family regulator